MSRRSLVFFVFVLSLALPSSGFAAGSTSMVSTGPAGEQSVGGAYSPSISANGRFVAFQSGAPNLVVPDTNDMTDIFVKDLHTGVTRAATYALNGELDANDLSLEPQVSNDGRYVVFTSLATNLTEITPPFCENVGQTCSQVYLRDMRLGITKMISAPPSGEAPNQQAWDARISADGRYAAFWSNAWNIPGPGGGTRLWVYNVATGGLEYVASGASQASLSHHGRKISFVTGYELDPSDTNDQIDCYVFDLDTGVYTLVSVAVGGGGANEWCWHTSISADGSKVSFESDATNLVLGDTNGDRDVFVRDLVHGTTQRVSVSSHEEQATSPFETTHVSYDATISGDGRFVAFTSIADNLVPGDTNQADDVFVRDLAHGTTHRVSLTWVGLQSVGMARTWKSGRNISHDGRRIVFQSSGSDMTPGSGGGLLQVYLRERG